MEGYKLFKEAVEDASRATAQWKYVGDGSIFTKQELLDMADVFDEKFPIGGWNYFLTFPDGEIGILSTDDNQIERLFLPPDSGSVKTATVKTEAVTPKVPAIDTAAIAIPPAAPASAAAAIAIPPAAPASAAAASSSTPLKQPKFCTRCGSGLKPGSRFCTGCGRPLEIAQNSPLR